MKSVLLLITVFSLSFSQMVWNLDKAHSSVSFIISHMVVAEVEGSFQTFDGKLMTESEDFDNSKVELVIETASIYTNNEKRDGHLKSPDFFDAKKFPKVTFKSTKFKKVSGNKYKVTGLLNMHGIEKEIELEGKFKGVIETKYGKKAGFKFTGTLKRYDYGLKYGQILEAGGLAIGNEVELEIRAELNLKKK